MINKHQHTLCKEVNFEGVGLHSGLISKVRLLPADPIVNDHYGDVLWKNGKEIQARYYWNYVLSLEKTEKDLKEKIKKKLIVGL